MFKLPTGAIVAHGIAVFAADSLSAQDYTVTPVTNSPSLRRMQELVDGYAELVLACKLPKDMGGKTIQVYVNEEGLLKDMHPNVGGTHYARIVSPSRPLGMLRGPVVVLFGTKALWR